MNGVETSVIILSSEISFPAYLNIYIGVSNMRGEKWFNSEGNLLQTMIRIGLKTLDQSSNFWR